MKSRLLLTTAFLFVHLWLLSNTLEVGLEDNFLYHEIQYAIDESTHGDTVLVYPGHYAGAINFIGKAITVTSLYIFSEDKAHIRGTVIDGNEESSTVKFYNSESRSSILCGFTITGGSGYTGYGGQCPEDQTYGGGIYIKHSSPWLRDCIIENNYACGGGGIYVNDYPSIPNYSYPKFENLTVRNNWGKLGSGGIYLRYNTNAEFDPIRRCSIYDNYSKISYDFCHPMMEEYPNSIDVYLDTISVNQPFPYHIYFGLDQDYIFDWLHYKREVIEEDIFVSPEGDNNNCGTLPDAPLKNLHVAFNLIYPADDNPLTVYIEEGHYSQQRNGDIFPLNFRDNLHIVGSGIDNTILDAEYNSQVIVSSARYTRNSSMDGFTITRGLEPGPIGGAVAVYGPQNTTLSNLKFLNNRSIFSYSALHLGSAMASPADSCNVVLRDIIFDGNLGNYVITQQNCDLYAENIIIRNSGSNLDAPDDWGRASDGSQFMGYYFHDEITNLTFVNCHFYDNHSQTTSGGVETMGSFNRRLNVIFYNCTFADNVSEPYGASILMIEPNVSVELQNCIFSNNNDYAVVSSYGDNNSTSLLVSHTLFEAEPAIAIPENQIVILSLF